MRTYHYPSDVTDEQWPLIEPHLPPARPGGRPREVDLRDVVDAVLYILRTGCQWRYLPKDFPPKSTVWRYFDGWRRDGTLDRIHDALRREVRAAERPYHPRTTASVDSQSVDTTSGGEHRGRDNAKNVDGRKRHLVVDSLGLLLAVLVTAASVDDAAAAPELFARLEGQPMGKVRRMYGDTKYHNFKLYEWVEANVRWGLEIIRRPEGKRGWVKLPIRWTVEIVRSQMTKTDMLALGAGGEDVADLDLVGLHDDPIDEQFDQLPLPIEGGGLKAGRDPLAERLQRGRQPERLVQPVRFAAEPPLLLGE